MFCKCLSVSTEICQFQLDETVLKPVISVPRATHCYFAMNPNNKYTLARGQYLLLVQNSGGDFGEETLQILDTLMEYR